MVVVGAVGEEHREIQRRGVREQLPDIDILPRAREQSTRLLERATIILSPMRAPLARCACTRAFSCSRHYLGHEAGEHQTELRRAPAAPFPGRGVATHVGQR